MPYLALGYCNSIKAPPVLVVQNGSQNILSSNRIGSFVSLPLMAIKNPLLVSDKPVPNALDREVRQIKNTIICFFMLNLPFVQHPVKMNLCCDAWQIHSVQKIGVV